jgi:hypothetical protein
MPRASKGSVVEGAGSQPAGEPPAGELVVADVTPRGAVSSVRSSMVQAPHPAGIVRLEPRPACCLSARSPAMMRALTRLAESAS